MHFLYAVRGAKAARSELVAQISTARDSSPYKLALANVEFRQGEFPESEKILETLAGETNAPKKALAAKLKLAKMDIDRKKLDAAEEWCLISFVRIARMPTRWCFARQSACSATSWMRR